MKQALKYFEDVILLAGRHFQFSKDELLGNRRTKRLAKVRQSCMRLVYENTDLSLPEVGSLFNRDHTTVLHACQVGGLDYYLSKLKVHIKVEDTVTESGENLNDFFKCHNFSKSTCTDFQI